MNSNLSNYSVLSVGKLSNIIIAAILLLTVFYNIGAGLPLLVDTDPAKYNLFFKVLSAVLFFFGMLGYIILRGDIKFSKYIIPVLIFWLVYSLRLIYDMEIAHVQSGFRKSELYSFAFGGALNSVLALSICGNIVNLGKFIRFFKAFVILANIVILILVVSKNSSINITLFLTRSSFTTSSLEDAAIINPITIAQNGALLIIVCVNQLLFDVQSVSKRATFIIFNISWLLIGLVNVLLGASRGPTLFCLLTVALIILNKLRQARFNAMFFRLLIRFAVIFVIVFSIFGKYINTEDILLFNRVSNIQETAVNSAQEERGIIYETAWSQFLNNPLFGDQFVEKTSKWYPHNIFLEALMATGILGTSLFILYIVLFFLFAYRGLNYRYNSLLSFIAIYYLLCCLTSGSLWDSFEIWIFPMLVIIQNSNAHLRVKI